MTAGRPPLVSVVTPARDAAHLIRETIDSIQTQTMANWEHLIVDDASEDGTAIVVANAARRDSRIRLIRREVAGGPFVAANEAIALAEGNYIACIDADDLCPPTRLERQLETLRAGRGARATISNWRWFTDDPRFGDESDLPTRDRVVLWYLGMRAFASNSSLMIERAAMRDIGGYRELDAAQDYALICDLARRGWLRLVPEILSFVRVHGAQRTAHIPAAQQRYGAEVMREHLAAISDVAWDPEQVETLFTTIHRPANVALRSGVGALDRWVTSWATDRSLDEQDREALLALRARHLRILANTHLKRHPVRAVLGGALGLRGRAAGGRL